MATLKINERLSIRSYKLKDAEALFHCIDSSRKHLRPWLTWIDATTRQEHSVQFIKNAWADEDLQKGLALGIFLEEKLIGGIGMHEWDHYLNRAQIGYWMLPAMQGKGIMQECASRFISFLFEKLKLNKVEIHYLPANTRSAALAARLGARVEGIIRHSMMVHGKPEDLVIAGILRSEWTPAR